MPSVSDLWWVAIHQRAYGPEFLPGVRLRQPSLLPSASDLALTAALMLLVDNSGWCQMYAYRLRYLAAAGPGLAQELV